MRKFAGILVFMCLFMRLFADQNVTGFMGITWGESQSIVETKLAQNGIVAINESTDFTGFFCITHRGIFNGMTAIIDISYSRQKMIRASVAYEVKGIGTYTEVFRELEAKYGKAVKENENDLYKSKFWGYDHDLNNSIMIQLMYFKETNSTVIIYGAPSSIFDQISNEKSDSVY